MLLHHGVSAAEGLLQLEYNGQQGKFSSALPTWPVKQHQSHKSALIPHCCLHVS